MCESQLDSTQKGGFRTIPFIIANESFEKVASYGLLPNMILYLMRKYNMDSATGANILFFWSATTNFLPIPGAFLSDSYLGRCQTIALGSIASLLGMILIWLTTMVPQARPPSCILSSERCISSAPAQLAILYSSFALMSIGAGGIRSCSIAFGADQLHQKDKSQKKRDLESFFNWYYASATFSVVIAMTLIVYIQENMGWKLGFGIPVILMLLSALLFFLASPFYVKLKPKKSLLTRFFQVLIASFRNRNLGFPPLNSDIWYHHGRDSKIVIPTNKLRCLNKACIIRNLEEDINPDGSALNPGTLSTVEQVEELKSLIRLIPLWSTGIMIGVNLSQGSFQLLQVNTMDRHLTKNFIIPSGSFGTFTIISIVVWIGIYDRILLPLISKITGRPYTISATKRMGIGLVISFFTMAVSGIVESVRRKIAINEGLIEDPNAVVNMSALWLLPQHILGGIAEAFNAVGQNEFYYSELPKSMSSIAAALFGLGLSLGNLVASFILTATDEITGSVGKKSWVDSNINQGHYDYYYWVIAFLSLLNIFYFLVCLKGYGTCEEERTVVSEEEEGKRE